MLDWKPDTNKTCNKCIHQEEYLESQEDTGIMDMVLKECSIPDDKNISSDDYLDDENINYMMFLVGIINNSQESMKYFTENQKHYESWQCFLANICPLYNTGD